MNRRRALWAMACLPGLAQAEGPPAGLRPLGKGTMRFLGFNVYEATLWVGPGFEPQAYRRSALALQLHYHRAFKAESIAERSLQEMRRVGEFTVEQAERWQAALRAALPDVAAGDRLLGLHYPGQGAEFRRGAQTTGRIDDPAFSELFFGIWLSPRTSAPELRQALLTAPG